MVGWFAKSARTFQTPGRLAKGHRALCCLPANKLISRSYNYSSGRVLIGDTSSSERMRLVVSRRRSQPERNSSSVGLTPLSLGSSRQQ